METERIEVGEIRINSKTGNPETCVEVCYLADGGIQAEWRDYEGELLHATRGMCPNCQAMYSLDQFKHVSELNISERKQEPRKKITIYIDEDEDKVFMTLLDDIANSYTFHKYPKNQAYGMIIKELITFTKVQSCLCSRCLSVPPHCHMPSWLV